MKDRERGYYWIKMTYSNDWNIAYYFQEDDAWFMNGLQLSEEYIRFIDETQIIRKS